MECGEFKVCSFDSHAQKISMKYGILNINKPCGMTSHDVVRDLRRLLGIKKIGHTGTLDPMASGVLPVCIGNATRVMEYTELDFKKYRASMRLGITTDTQDIWGEVLQESPTDGITEDDVRRVLSGMTGLITQTPPMYSAVKVNGKKLYEYAREGKQVDVKSRTIFIRSIDIENIDLAGDEKSVTFSVECSKGTYIRTICEEAGKALGCGAAMSSLVRTASGAFRIEDALDLDYLIDTFGSRKIDGEKYFVQPAGPEGLAEIEKLALPIDFPLVHFGQAIMDEETARRFINGWHISMPECEITRQPEFAEAGEGCGLCCEGTLRGAGSKQEEPEDIRIREDYRHAYNMYVKKAGASGSNIAGDLIFLGVAFYNKKYKKLVADKVLLTEF